MKVPRIARIVTDTPQNPRSSGFFFEERREKMAYGKGYGGKKMGGSKSGGMSYGGKKGNIELSPSGKQSKPAPCGPPTPRK